MASASAPPTIRSAVAEDLPAVTDLLVASALPVDGVREVLHEMVVADSDGVVVGAAAIEPCGSVALLRSVVVAPGWRSRGVARGLVSERLRRSGQIGIGEVFLLTETAEDFFARLGFRSRDRAGLPESIRATQEFAQVCPVSAVAMSISI